MKSFITTTILSLTALAAALPSKNLEVRTPGSVTFCTGTDYTGDCFTTQVPYNECQILPAPYYKNLGSIKVDVGALCRITYTADTCTSHGDSFVWPNPSAPNLHAWNDPYTGEIIDAGKRVTSYLCQECTACTEEPIGS